MSSSQKQHTLHLMVYHRALFKAHWALFVPSLTNHDIGKRIDASGDVRKGFHHVLTRNFDLKMEDRTYSLIEIGALTKGCCLDDELGEEAVDEGPTVAGARNELERLMLGVEAPGPSMRSANSQSSVTGRAELRDCQDWVRDVVDVLIAEGKLDAGAADIVRRAPQH